MSAFFIFLKKHVLAMLLVFFLIAGSVATWTFFRTSVYQAGARINVPEIKKKEGVEQQGISVQTAVELLKGNVLAEQVMTVIGITRIFPDLEQNTQGEKDFLSHALANFQQQLNITQVQDTRIISIRFQHQEAEVSAQVVETMIRLFQKEYRKFLSPEESLHNEQLLLARQEMHQTSLALSLFQQRNKLLFVGEPPDKLTEQYDTLKNLLASEQETLQGQVNELAQLEKQFVTPFKSDLPGHQDKQQNEPEGLNEVQQDLIRLKLYEQELLGKYGEGGSGDRLIANVRLQIASLEELIYTKAAIPKAEQEKLDDTAEQIVFARMSYQKRQKKIELLQRQMGQVKNKLERVAKQDGVLGELQQQAETARKRYASLTEQFETERKLKERAEQIQIIEKPVVPSSPIKPKQGATLILALLSGLIGSIVYGVIRAAGNRTSTN
jgi:uncharacterized protein involved in exopolysaccharide biosynthesis